MSDEPEMISDAYPELEQEAEAVAAGIDDRPASSTPTDWSISTLREKYERNQIDLQPTYQRQYVWALRPELPSRLIESLLLQIPIPPIYFGKLTGAKLEVIDGQQRLTTLIKFVRNDVALTKLQRMPSLNRKRFRDLSEEHQSQILDASIRSVVIDAGQNHNLRYEVFERLNRGSMALNEQELRNCVYRGPFCDLLTKLEVDPLWRKVKGAGLLRPPLQIRKRFLGREFTARVEGSDRIIWNNQIYGSLTMAARAAIASVKERGGKTIEAIGWKFWQFQDKDGQWRDMNELRLRYLSDRMARR